MQFKKRESAENNFKTAWDDLSEKAKTALKFLFPMGPETPGVNQGYLNAMGISEGDIQEVIKAGFIEEKIRHEVAQEYLDTHREAFEALTPKRKGRITLTPAETELYQKYAAEEHVVKRGSLENVYRFTPSAYDFIKQTFNR